jgi:Phage-related tail fibre protein
MSNYNTGNPPPSIDPRDLDDNATVFDNLVSGTNASYPDRLGVQRKSWAQMEADAEALISPNVAALAAVTAAVDKGFFFNAVTPIGMGTYTLTSFSRSLGVAVDAPAFRTAIGAMALTDTGAYAGSAAKLTTARTLSITGDGAWSMSFDGSANATAALTLAASGVSAGTYGSVTVNAKGLVTAASTATPIANGGTGATTATAAGTNLGTATVGTNTDQLARSSMIQAEIANKRTWTSYTPTITPSSGSFSNATATGSYMVAFGICYFYATLTITTKGTGTFPQFTLPVAALAGAVNQSIQATERAINGKSGVAQLTSATVARCKDSANGDLVTADGCIVTIMGSYPVA